MAQPKSIDPLVAIEGISQSKKCVGLSISWVEQISSKWPRSYTSRIPLEVNGEISATNKSFVINHPTKPDMKLRYGSLEGPENGVYVRGILKDNIIYLPDYWVGLVDENTITVNLTPLGNSYGLRVEKIENNTVFVKSYWWSKISCFYTVFAERKDVAKLKVEF